MKGIQLVRALSKPLASSATKAINKSLFSNQFTWNQLAVKQIRFFAAETQTAAATQTPTHSETAEKKRDPLREENGLLSRFVRAGRFAEAEKVFKGFEAKGLVPNEYTYNIALNMYRQKGDLKNLFNVFEEMKQKGVPPSTVTYSTMFSAFEQGGDLKDLMKLYQEMKDSNIPLATPIFNIIFGVVSLRGELSLIEPFLTEMSKLNFKPDEYTMTSIISAFGRKGDITGVLKYWDHFVNLGVKVDERSYYPVLDAYAKKGNLAGLTEWFNKYKDAGLKKNIRVYNILIDGCTRGRNLDLAMQNYDEMISFGIKPDRYIYMNIFRAVGNTPSEDRSSLIDKLFSEMRETHQIPPDGRIASAMLQAFGKLRKVQKSLHVIEMVKEFKLGLYAASLSSFVERLRRDKLIAGRIDEQAIKFTSQMNQKPQSFVTTAEIDEVLNLLRSVKPSIAIQNLAVKE